MNTIMEKYKVLEEKYPLVAIPLAAAIIAAVITAGTALVLYLVVAGMGLYETLETAIDLKVDSPALLIPMWTAGLLTVVCGMCAVLMFFHKYKRPKVKSKFYNALAPVLGMEKGKKG